MSAPAPQQGTVGDLTKPVANVDEVKARINSREPGQPWHQPLLNPFQDPVRCLIGYCCGPCMYGFNAAAIEGNDDWIVPALVYYLASCFCLQWYVGQPTRSKLRQKYGLEEAPYSDCITHTGLCCFAICQESAELDFRKNNGDAGKPTAAPTAAPAAAPAPGSYPPTTDAPPVQKI